MREISLINAFIGEERHIVTDIAGTTRDSIYHRYNKFGFDFYLVDTAGIRKKQKVNEDIEYYSVIFGDHPVNTVDRSRHPMLRNCILMIDGRHTRNRGSGPQQTIYKVRAAIEAQPHTADIGLMLGAVCVNKWDLVEDKSIIPTIFQNLLNERTVDAFGDPLGFPRQVRAHPLPIS